MKTNVLFNNVKKILAAFMVAYFAVISPISALAVEAPVSVPVSVPVTPPAPTPVPSPSPKPTPSPVPSPAPAPKAFISVNNSSVVSGANLNISWNVPSASATDYIRVLTLDNKNAGPMGISPSNNCNLNNVSGSTAVKSGNCAFTSAVISDLGTFKLAYYNNSGSLIATSNTFKVLPASSGTLTITSSNIGIGTSVNLNWANITNTHPKDNINYLNVDNYTGTAAGHTYWPSGNCTWFPTNTAPASSGKCSIESPMLRGNYKLVYRSGNVPLGQPAPILAVSNVINVSTISAPTPDLSIDIKSTVENSNIGVGTSTSNSFAKITLTTTVKNIGSSSAQPSVTQINTNNINEYWRLSTNSLAPGASQVLTVTTYKTPGTYQFKAIADADRQITESNEDNNTAMTSVTIEAPKPDLTVVNLVPGSFKVGEKGEFKVTVKNIGQADAIIKNDNFYLAFVLKKDGSKYGIALTSYFGQMQTLKAGETKTFTTQTYYKLTQAGKYTFSSDIDALKQINESNENNNIATSSFEVVNPAPQINSITPNSTVVGSIAQVAGSNFGNKQGYVTFYNQRGQASGGAPILGWFDGGVKFKVPAVAKGTYSVEVQAANGAKSNRISFTVIASQPKISSLYTYSLSWGGYFIIYGQDLGKSGKINLYNTNSSVPFYNAKILSWSDTLIVGQISPKVGGNTTYGFQVSTSDNRQSSITYRYVSK